MATHHFYHSKPSFARHENIAEQEALAASGAPVVIGKRKVKLPFEEDIIVETYHTPKVSKIFSPMDYLHVDITSHSFLVQKMAKAIATASYLDDQISPWY